MSDLLSVRVKNVQSDVLSISEHKTGKRRSMLLPAYIVRAIGRHVNRHGLGLDDFLFAAASGAKPISRQHAHRVIRAAGAELGLDGLGTHSMRKTYAYNLLRRSRSVGLVQEALNHEYLSTTYGYVIDGLMSHLPRSAAELIPVASLDAPSES